MGKHRASPPRAPRLDKWEVQQAADTLLGSERVKKNPKLLRAARTELKSRATAAMKAARSK